MPAQAAASVACALTLVWPAPRRPVGMPDYPAAPPPRPPPPVQVRTHRCFFGPANCRAHGSPACLPACLPVAQTSPRVPAQVVLKYSLTLSTRCNAFDPAKLAEKLNGVVAGRLAGAATSVKTEYTCTDLFGAAAQSALSTSRAKGGLLSALSIEGLRRLLQGAEAAQMDMKTTTEFPPKVEDPSGAPGNGGGGGDGGSGGGGGDGGGGDTGGSIFDEGISPTAALSLVDNVVADLATDAARTVDTFAREEGVVIEATVAVGAWACACAWAGSASCRGFALLALRRLPSGAVTANQRHLRPCVLQVEPPVLDCAVDQGGANCEGCPPGQHSAGGANAVCAACGTGYEWSYDTLACSGEAGGHARSTREAAVSCRTPRGGIEEIAVLPQTACTVTARARAPSAMSALMISAATAALTRSGARPCSAAVSPPRLASLLQASAAGAPGHLPADPPDSPSPQSAVLPLVRPPPQCVRPAGPASPATSATSATLGPTATSAAVATSAAAAPTPPRPTGNGTATPAVSEGLAPLRCDLRRRVVIVASPALVVQCGVLRLPAPPPLQSVPLDGPELTAPPALPDTLAPTARLATTTTPATAAPTRWAAPAAAPPVLHLALL